MSLFRSLFVPPSQRVVEPAQVREPVIGPSSTVALRSSGTTQVPDWDALTAIQQGYLANLVVYRCVQLNARKIASLPFRTGKVAPDPGDAGEFDVNAPLAQKLGPPPGGPNPDTSPSVLWTHSIAQRQVTGRFGWEIEHGARNGPPAALWPLLSQYLRPVPAGKGQLVDDIPRYFVRYEYNPGGVRRELDWNQVYYDWVPSQYDFHQPESPLQAARLPIGAAVLQDLYDTAFLKNGGVPAYVVVTQAFEDLKAREAFRAQFTSEYSGPTKAGKTAFAESLSENASQSFDIKTIGQTAKDSQALEKYKENLEGIAMALGVPWGKLSNTDRTYANAEADDIAWEIDTIVPLCVEISENINIRLAPMFGDQVGWFDMTGLKVFAKKKQYQAVSPLDAHARGEISLNEARVALGEEPVEGGDEIPALTAATEEPAEAQEPDQLPAATPADIKALISEAIAELKPSVEDARAAKLEGSQRAKALPVPVAVAPQPQGDPPQSPAPLPAPLDAAVAKAELRAKKWHSIDAQARGIELTWVQQLRAVVARQERAVQANLKGKRARQAYERAVGDDQPDPEVIFDSEFWKAEVAATARGIYSTIMAMSVGNAVRDIGSMPLNFDPTNELVVAFINQRANLLAGQITDTTFRAIQDQLIQGIEAGEGIPELAERLRGLVGLDPIQANALQNLKAKLQTKVDADKMSQTKADQLIERKREEMHDYRLTRIARTETIPRYNESNALLAGFYPDDVVAGREYLATRDARVRDEHLGADGQQRRTGVPFNVGVWLMNFPGDNSLGAPSSQTIQCRCTTAMLTPEEFEDERSMKTKYVRVAEVQRELARIALGAAA